MIDTHCHLTYDGLYERAEQVIADAHAAGVGKLITIATTPGEAQKVLGLTQQHPGVYAAIGVHPHYAAQCGDVAQLANILRPLLAQPKVVALGEMGLDLHYPEPPLNLQQKVFEAQLELMKQQPNLPGIIHNREATPHTIAMIRASGIAGERFVFHCFTGLANELEQILELGAMVGFTGITTFKSAAALALASDMVPLERLLVETDAPYLTPEPYRKVKINEPKYVMDVARCLAARRKLSLAELESITDANAQRFFGIAS